MLSWLDVRAGKIRGKVLESIRGFVVGFVCYVLSSDFENHVSMFYGLKEGQSEFAQQVNR